MRKEPNQEADNLPELQIEIIQNKLNEKINNELSYVWIELQDYLIDINSIDDLLKKDIEIERGYEIDEQTNSLAHAYFGWSIELNKNKYG